MNLLKRLFGSRKPALNKPVVRHSNISAKILYSNCQIIRDGCYRYTIELNEHIPMDKMDEIISNSVG